ncbi:MAG TPA: hypothetical protein VK191_12475, partial [Symbiobacteriaceae bacterium]|nr:hypothetical protein [Symbiobacteriaceae bacterium]
PITCSQCGAQNEEGNFCFQCGGRLGAVPPPAQPPFPGAQPVQQPFPGAQPVQQPFPGGQHAAAQQFPGGYPQQPFPGGYSQPPRKSGGPKALLAVLGLVVLVGGGWYAKTSLFPTPATPTPAPAPAPAPTPTPTPTPTPSTQGTQTNPGTKTTPPATNAALKATQVMNGNFKLGQADIYDANGSYLAAAKDSQAIFYRFGKDGTYTQLATVTDTAAGPVRHVAVGDLNNNGNPVMVVSYDNVLHILRTDGTTSKLEEKTSKVLIGDFTGDGKKEALFVLPQSDGKDALQVIEFGGAEPKELALIKTDPVPTNLFHGHVHSDGVDLLSSFRRDGNNLVFILYKMDLAKGLVPVVEYPVADPTDRPASWYGTGTIYDGGAGMAITRTGTKPTVDLYALNVDGAVQLGTFNLPGGKDHAVLLGTFQGDEPRVMSIDENGAFYIYKVSE